MARPTVEREGDTKTLSKHKKDKCTGCGICTDICPTEALKLGPLVPIAEDYRYGLCESR